MFGCLVGFITLKVKPPVLISSSPSSSWSSHGEGCRSRDKTDSCWKWWCVCLELDTTGKSSKAGDYVGWHRAIQLYTGLTITRGCWLAQQTEARRSQSQRLKMVLAKDSTGKGNTFNQLSGQQRRTAHRLKQLERGKWWRLQQTIVPALFFVLFALFELSPYLYCLPYLYYLPCFLYYLPYLYYLPCFLYYLPYLYYLPCFLYYLPYLAKADQWSVTILLVCIWTNTVVPVATFNILEDWS